MTIDDSDLLTRLQDWYAKNCDGDWEHGSGIKIESIDNPGWQISLDISGTLVEGRLLDRVVVEESEEYWLHYWSDGHVLRAVGGPRCLQWALRVLIGQLDFWQQQEEK